MQHRPQMPVKVAACDICGVHYDNWGNNANPYPGRCCAICFVVYVIPARLARLPYPQDPKKQTRNRRW